MGKDYKLKAPDKDGGDIDAKLLGEAAETQRSDAETRTQADLDMISILSDNNLYKKRSAAYHTNCCSRAFFHWPLRFIKVSKKLSHFRFLILNFYRWPSRSSSLQMISVASDRKTKSKKSL